MESYLKTNWLCWWRMTLTKQSKWIGWSTCRTQAQFKPPWAHTTSSLSLIRKLWTTSSISSRWIKKFLIHFPRPSTMKMRRTKKRWIPIWDSRKIMRKIMRKAKITKMKPNRLLKMRKIRLIRLVTQPFSITSSFARDYLEDDWVFLLSSSCTF